jgi:hypothetical protein
MSKFFIEKSIEINAPVSNSVITYEFSEKNGITTVLAREDFTNPIPDDEYAEAADGWDTALGALKDIAESIHSE